MPRREFGALAAGGGLRSIRSFVRRLHVARSSMMAKLRRKPKFKIRHRNRCLICGRPRGYIGKFKMCRLHFRELALRGDIPGVIKSSW